MFRHWSYKHRIIMHKAFLILKWGYIRREIEMEYNKMKKNDCEIGVGGEEARDMTVHIDISGVLALKKINEILDRDKGIS